MPLLTDASRPTQSLAPSPLVQDLVPGLLLFFARPSGLQTWAEAFGHEWRHVGVTVETEDGLRIASYGPRKCFRLDDPAEIMSAYTRVGAARVVDTDAEVAALEQFCLSYQHHSRAEAPYLFSSILVGPLHLYARRLPPGALRSVLFAIVYLYCALQRLRYRSRDAYVCSTFAWAAVDAVRPQPLRIPLSAHPDDVAAYATASTPRDELYARWLCGPTELWNAISESSRCDLDLDTIDLRDPHPASLQSGRDGLGALVL